MAWLLCAGLAGLGIAICAKNFGKAITCLYSLGLFLGTIYRYPPCPRVPWPLRFPHTPSSGVAG